MVILKGAASGPNKLENKDKGVALGGQPFLSLPNTNKPVGDPETPLAQLLKPNAYENVSDSPEAQSTIQVLFSTHNNLRQHIYHVTKR